MKINWEKIPTNILLELSMSLHELEIRGVDFEDCTVEDFWSDLTAEAQRRGDAAARLKWRVDASKKLNEKT